MMVPSLSSAPTPTPHICYATHLCRTLFRPTPFPPTPRRRPLLGLDPAPYPILPPRPRVPRPTPRVGVQPGSAIDNSDPSSLHGISVHQHGALFLTPKHFSYIISQSISQHLLQERRLVLQKAGVHDVTSIWAARVRVRPCSELWK